MVIFLVEPFTNNTSGDAIAGSGRQCHGRNYQDSTTPIPYCSHRHVQIPEVGVILQ